MKISLMSAAVLIAYFFSKVTGRLIITAYPVYNGTDLGLTYSPTQSAFRIWSPPADNAQLLIYIKWY